MEKEIIGDAVLYRGDCLEVIGDLDPIDMVFTDPPYGHNNNDGDLIHNWAKALGKIEKDNSESRPIANDGEEIGEILEAALIALKGKMNGASAICCCCGGGGPDPMFARWSLMLDKIFSFKHMVVWDKGPIGMGWHYRRSYETVLVAEKAKGKGKWRDKTDKIENIIRPGQYGIKKRIPSKDDHPTPKPYQLARYFIRLHTDENDVVCDPFMGSGSTGVGALEIGRKFVGIEIDKRWFDMACENMDAVQRQQRLAI